MDTVYLTAAAIYFMDKIPYQYERSFSINVRGTENVIAACKAKGVKYLVETSTMHVTVPCDRQGVVETDETDPYVTEQNCLSYYGLTKAMAEKLVLEASTTTSDGLKTVAVRPPGACVSVLL
jgi:3beta-hydroxy-Delta5-steroid dehydrogenase / steroid Delta-isomerase